MKTLIGEIKLCSKMKYFSSEPIKRNEFKYIYVYASKI